MAIAANQTGRRRYWCRCVLTLLLFLGGSWPARASGPFKSWFGGQKQEAATSNSHGSMTTPRDTTPRTSLKCLSATWQTVLERVARDCGMTLVADKYPEGRFTWRDSKEYTRTEAINILNRELESEKYRLVEKGNFLLLLELNALRARYSRPVLPTRPEPVQNQTRPRDAEGIETAGSTVAASGSTGSAQTARKNRALLPRDANSIQQTANTEPAPQPKKDPIASIEVKLNNQRAADVARLIYYAYAENAVKINDGPRGLPGIQLLRPRSESFREVNAPASGRSFGSFAKTNGAREAADTSDVLLTVGISTDWNQLVVEGPRDKAEALSKLIQWLDRVKLKPDDTIRLVSSEKDVAGIARNLQPQLKNLITKDVQQGPPQQRLAQRQFAPQQRQDTGANGTVLQPQDRILTQPAPGQPSEYVPLVGGLKGPVTIESLPELGIMILHGNEEDVEKVKKVIEEIEDRTAGTAPEIHIQALKNVNSEALATLLESVYEKLGSVSGAAAAAAQQKVSVVPIVKPNAVMIIAPQAVIPSVRDLIDKLDVPVDPEMEFEVFNLKNAIASQVVTAIQGMYPTDRPPLGTKVTAYADARTNSVIVQARPNDLEEVARLIQGLDLESPASVNEIRRIQLRNAVAQDLADVINTAIQSVLNPPAPITGQFGQAVATTGQNTQQLQEVKSAILQFAYNEGAQQRLIRSGILADIRVTADARTNSLMVTAPKQSMDLIVALIGELDKPTETIADIKLFPLKNADASRMVELLQSMFAPPTTAGEPTVQFAGAEGASSGIVPVRFGYDTRSNTVMAVGSTEALRVVNAVLISLDQGDLLPRETKVVQLSNSSAPDVATAINNFLTSERNLRQGDANLTSPYETLEREIIVEAEPTTNNLLISATPHYIDRIDRIIKSLDEVPRQVVIQSLIVEVELDDTDEFGVQVGIQDPLLFARGLVDSETSFITETTTTQLNGTTVTTQDVVSQAINPGFPFNNQPLGNNSAANPSRIGTQGLVDTGVGRMNSQLGVGGLVISASSNSLQFLLRSLQSNRRVDVLSRPTIRALNNEPASIQVGQQVPIVEGVTIDQGIVSPNVNQQDAGIILTVTPRISPEGLVVMRVDAQKSAFEGQGQVIFTDAATGNVVTSPVKNITEAITTVSVGDGQTVVIGGMITKTTDTMRNKVPWLGELPWVGPAFRYDSYNHRRTELLIFLTPRILHSDADDEFIKQVEIERLNFIESDAEEMHGPLRAVPADGQCKFPMQQPPPMPQDDYPDVPTTIMPPNPIRLSPGLDGAFEPRPAQQRQWGASFDAAGPALFEDVAGNRAGRMKPAPNSGSEEGESPPKKLRFFPFPKPRT